MISSVPRTLSLEAAVPWRPLGGPAPRALQKVKILSGRRSFCPWTEVDPVVRVLDLKNRGPGAA